MFNLSILRLQNREISSKINAHPALNPAVSTDFAVQIVSSFISGVMPQSLSRF